MALIRCFASWHFFTEINEKINAITCLRDVIDNFLFNRDLILIELKHLCVGCLPLAELILLIVVLSHESFEQRLKFSGLNGECLQQIRHFY